MNDEKARIALELVKLSGKDFAAAPLYMRSLLQQACELMSRYLGDYLADEDSDATDTIVMTGCCASCKYIRVSPLEEPCISCRTNLPSNYSKEQE